MKYTAIIFDMDGTIIDSEHVWASANRKLIERKGITFTPEIAQQLQTHIHGLAIEPVCSFIKNITGIPDSLQDLVVEKKQIAKDLFAEGITFIEGFTDFHTLVKAKNLKTGIATNADEHFVAITQNVLRLDTYFGPHVYNISHVNYVYKPSPDLYLYAAEQLECSPEECIAIEDSAHGIRAAKRAGMFCIGINTSRDRSRLQEADYIIDEYQHIDLDKLLE